MAKIKLTNRHVITTFIPPPKNINLQEVEDEILLKHGFPRKPIEDKKLLALWKKFMSRRYNYIVPTFLVFKSKQK